MKAWGLASEEHYRELPLTAHVLLLDVPLHDVWSVVLPANGRPGTMMEVRKVAAGMGGVRGLGLVVPILFAVRKVIGTVLGWDVQPPGEWVSSVPSGLPDDLVERSLVLPGTTDGPFRISYVLEHEAMSETRNATVEAYLVGSIQPHAEGFELLFAVHVRHTGALTGPYLALIAPFRRFLVYPTLLRRFHRQWSAMDS